MRFLWAQSERRDTLRFADVFDMIAQVPVTESRVAGPTNPVQATARAGWRTALPRTFRTVAAAVLGFALIHTGASAATPQSMTVAPIADQFVGAAPVPLWGSASSGLPVAFSSLTPETCAVSNNRVQGVTAGACTLRASQPGNASYAPAPLLDRTVFVRPAISGPALAVAANYGVGMYPDGVVIADFDRDGRLDLAAVNWSEGTVSILLGRGDGTFAAPATVAAGVGPMALAVADLNGDGKPDIAVSNLLSQNVTVLLGNGDGTFSHGPAVPVGAALFGIVAGDFNGDGKVDLAVANGSSAGVAGQRIFLLFGTGNGGFQMGGSIPVGRNPMALATADVDGDGKLDLIVANADDHSVSVLLAVGNGSFSVRGPYPVGWSPHGVAAGDVNGDGRPDLVVSNAWSNSVSVLLNSGGGTFVDAVTYTTGSAPGELRIGDFTGDGKPDIAVINQFDDSLSLLAGNGDGTFGVAVPHAVLTYPSALAMGDFNGDGKPDLVVAAAGSDALSVLLGASPNAVAATLSTAAGTPQKAAVNTTYATPFAVLVQDAGQRPAANVPVTFTAPSTGASGSFAANRAVTAFSGVDGLARAPAFTANATTGSFTVVAATAALSATFALTNVGVLATTPPSFTSGPFPPGVVNSPYSFLVAATGNPPPTFAVLASALPSGLRLDTTSGAVSGTPLVAGTFASIVTASNGTPPDAMQSFAIAIARANQTLAFPQLSDKYVDSTPFLVAATASSGLDVVVASLSPGVCAVMANLVSMVSAGTCVLRASQAGSAQYQPAEALERTFVVSKLGQTITFVPVDVPRLGSDAVTVTATSTSGLAVTLRSLTPTICTIDGSRLFPLAVGNCLLRATQAGSGHFLAAADVDQGVVVQPALQTVVFASPGPRGLGESPIVLSAYANSGSTVAFASLTPAVCTISGARAILVATGTCTIVASQGGDGRFAAAIPVTRAFDVQPAVLAAGATAAAPYVEYLTVFRGASADRVFDIALAPDGAAYVTGAVVSSDFPGLSSSTTTNAGLDLTFLTKLDAAGRSLASAVVGGRSPRLVDSARSGYVGADQVEAMAVDSAGNAYIAAYGHATDLPLRPGAYAVADGKYVYRIPVAGGPELVAGPLDQAITSVRALAVDPAGNLYLAGVAAAGLTTTSNAAVSVATAGNGGPFAIKLATGGATMYATYLGVSGTRPASPASPGQSTWDADTTPYAIAVDAAGNAVIAGQATAGDLPATAGSPDTTDTRNRDAVVVKLNALGTAVVFVARLGGSDADRATSVALARDGSIVVGGKTATQPFRGTTGSFQPTVVFDSGVPREDRETGFVAILSADGRAWTAVAGIGAAGGSLVDWRGSDPLPVKVAVDPSGAVYVAGTTFPNRTLPVIRNIGGAELYGAFVMKMTRDLSRLDYATALGRGIAVGIAVDAYGTAHVAGYDPHPFVAKVNAPTMPLVLDTDVAAPKAGQSFKLRATTADPRFAGMVTFGEDGVVLGSGPVTNGVAELTTALSAGVHRIRATFQGEGPFGSGSIAERVFAIAPSGGAMP
ncbi:MAG: FG-GAP-like repeat-containing protein [Casimicrobiaceae bacterium]